MNILWISLHSATFCVIAKSVVMWTRKQEKARSIYLVYHLCVYQNLNRKIYYRIPHLFSFCLRYPLLFLLVSGISKRWFQNNIEEYFQHRCWESHINNNSNNNNNNNNSNNNNIINNNATETTTISQLLLTKFDQTLKECFRDQHQDHHQQQPQQNQVLFNFRNAKKVYLVLQARFLS